MFIFILKSQRNASLLRTMLLKCKLDVDIRNSDCLLLQYNVKLVIHLALDAGGGEVCNAS